MTFYIPYNTQHFISNLTFLHLKTNKNFIISHEWSTKKRSKIKKKNWCPKQICIREAVVFVDYDIIVESQGMSNCMAITTCQHISHFTLHNQSLLIALGSKYKRLGSCTYCINYMAFAWPFHVLLQLVFSLSLGGDN